MLAILPFWLLFGKFFPVDQKKMFNGNVSVTKMITFYATNESFFLWLNLHSSKYLMIWGVWTVICLPHGGSLTYRCESMFCFVLFCFFHFSRKVQWGWVPKPDWMPQRDWFRLQRLNPPGHSPQRVSENVQFLLNFLPK